MFSRLTPLVFGGVHYIWAEDKEKLNEARPATMAAAARISGVTPSVRDPGTVCVCVLCVEGGAGEIAQHL